MLAAAATGTLMTDGCGQRSRGKPADFSCPENMVAVAGGVVDFSDEPHRPPVSIQLLGKQKVADFCVDEREYSFADFTVCLDEGRCGPLARGRVGAGGPGGENYPLAGLTLAQSAEICAVNGKRLPSFFEWSLVARLWEAGDWQGGSGCVGFTEDAVGKTAEERLRSIQCEVATSGSRSGLYDVAGNVSEWVQYSSEEFVYFRGGNSESSRTRPYFWIERSGKNYRFPDLGFRCVADPPGDPSRRT